VHKALEGLSGARVAGVDVERGRLLVRFDPSRTDLDAVEEALDASPYERIATGPVIEVSPSGRRPVHDRSAPDRPARDRPVPERPAPDGP